MLLPRREFLRRAATAAALATVPARLRAAAHGLTIGFSQYSLKGLFAAG